MSPQASPEVTLYLQQIENGDRSAIDRLLPYIYGDLRALADRAFVNQPAGQTLQPTALVNEAYLKLVGSDIQNFESRRHFLSVASMAMRQLLTDHARRRASAKRGGGWNKVLLDEATPSVTVNEEVDLLALDVALEKLQEVDERQARIVELRFLAGMSYDEIAEVVGIAPRTARLDWQMARAWLRREMDAAAGA